MSARKPFAFLALFIILFLDGFGQSFIFPILTKTLENPSSTELVNHVSQTYKDAIYTLAIGLYFLFWAFGAAILGDLSDAWGRKKCIVICLIGMAISNVIIGSAFYYHSIWLLLGGRILMGLTAGTQSVSQATISDMTTDKNRGRVTGLILLAITLGILVGPMFGEFFSNASMVSWFNNQVPFYIFSGVAIIVMLMLSFSFQNIRPPVPKKIHIGHLFSVFKDAATHKHVRKLCLAFLLMFTTWPMYYFYMNIYFVQHLHATDFDITLYMTLLGLGMSIGMAIVPRFIEGKFSDKNVFLTAFIIIFLLTICTQFSDNLTLDLIITVLLTTAAGTGFVFILKFFSSFAGADKQGWIMGIFNACWITACGVTTIVSGWLATHNPSLPFYVTYVSFVIGTLIFLGVKAPKK